MALGNQQVMISRWEKPPKKPVPIPDGVGRDLDALEAIVDQMSHEMETRGGDVQVHSEDVEFWDSWPGLDVDGLPVELEWVAAARAQHRRRLSGHSAEIVIASP